MISNVNVDANANISAIHNEQVINRAEIIPSSSKIPAWHTLFFSRKKHPSPKIEKILPGFLVIRNFATDAECKKLAKTARTLGQQGEDGFYTSTEGSKEQVLNTGEKGRGRIYDAATRFPSFVTNHCNKAVKIAKQNDGKMPGMACTHVLLNMYTTTAGLVWHRDIYENDGSSDHPVVNLCVGASCEFGYKMLDNDPEQSIILRSGDCLLFGGPARLIKHAVLSVDLRDCPDWMKDDPVRFSFTFRDSPEVLGREDEFKYFRPKDHLVGQDEIDLKKINSKKRIGLPSLKSQRSTFDERNRHEVVAA